MTRNNFRLLQGVHMKALVLKYSIILIFIFSCIPTVYAQTIKCWFPPSWRSKPAVAKKITTALSQKSGINIQPRIARSYPQILKAFDSADMNLVYVGSFVQAIINARNLGIPLVQSLNDKELYSGVLVYPKGEDPKQILDQFPAKIAYAKGASSGESSAKAATAGKAKIQTTSHSATSRAIVAGKAKAGVVKNWWWQSNRSKFPQLAMYKIPGVSLEKNPDNVLTASKSVPANIRNKIIAAAKESKDDFGAKEIATFDPSLLQFSLQLMEKGKIDPQTYNW